MPTRAGVPWSNPFAIVHSAYWLTAAETGYLGVITFVFLWLQITWVSIRCAWKYKKDYRGDIMLGLAATLVVIALHNAYEWVFFLYSAQYLFAITAGMVAALAEQLGYWGARRQACRRRSKRTSTRHRRRWPTIDGREVRQIEI